MPWSLVTKCANAVQYVFAASCAAAYVLYAGARAAIGAEEFAARLHDPKELGSGLLNVVIRVVHAFTMFFVLLGPWLAVPSAVLSMVGIVIASRQDASRLVRWSVAAVVLTAAVVVVDQLPASDAVRRWILD